MAASSNATRSQAEGCGYVADVRHELPSIGALSYFLLPALGSCTEYGPSANTDTQILPTLATDPFVHLAETASFCVGGSAGLPGWTVWWIGALNALLFAGYLLRLRRMQVTEERIYDKAVFSAADYAVIITGLEITE